MERMYNKFKDVADFRMIYIREAHAADGPRPMGTGKSLGITEHKNYADRCQTAEMLINDRSLTMPMLIDDMENTTNQAYQAHPDRVFLVRTDGRLAVAAERGPWGFAPGLKAAEQWLEAFKKTGEEPALARPAEQTPSDR
ncbi:MAG: hypothetical protein GY819_00010 [Planctomycetaceae bacterium]|nr:hypothetical protein [Planctomycetaceae bacterium]MCP4461161.1 hypothetical protein [Planctomycetaceae bacterium]